MKSHKLGNFTGKDQQGFRPMQYIKKGKLQQRDTMMAQVMKFFQEEDGGAALEYVLLAGLITSVIIMAVTALGGIVSSSFSNTADSLNAVN